MTLKQVAAFYWAAKLGSFSLAALRLHVTQSSLSKRIVELEEAVGSALFDRSTKRARLTPAGERLLPLAGKMLDLEGQFEREAAATEHLAGICRFGVSEMVSLTWLPAFTRQVNERHPGLLLEPYVDLARSLERKVHRGELDFSVAPGPGQGGDVQASVVGRVEFSWVASPARIADGALLGRQDLERHPIIMMTEGSGLTRAVLAWATDQGITMQRILNCNSLMAIVALVLSDVGISFLPTQFMRPWIRERLLVSLRSDPPLPSLDYCFFQRDDDRRSLLSLMRTYVLSVADFSGIPRSLAPLMKVGKRMKR